MGVRQRHGTFRDVLLPHVDLVVGLDYPRWFTFVRLLHRTVRRVVTREEVCNGNVETLGRVLGSDSILRWHFRSFHRKRERMRALEAAPEGPPVLIFSRAKYFEAWLEGLPAPRS